jgi:hypothetical protein
MEVYFVSVNGFRFLCGRWEMGNGRWEMIDGRWEMGDVRMN